jgi:hypothetical protein
MSSPTSALTMSILASYKNVLRIIAHGGLSRKSGVGLLTESEITGEINETEEV